MKGKDDPAVVLLHGCTSCHNGHTTAEVLWTRRETWKAPKENPKGCGGWGWKRLGGRGANKEEDTVDGAGSALLNSTHWEHLCSIFGVIHGLGGSDALRNRSELMVMVTSTDREALFLLITWYPPALGCQQTQKRDSNHCCESLFSFTFPRPWCCLLALYFQTN